MFSLLVCSALLQVARCQSGVFFANTTSNSTNNSSLVASTSLSSSPSSSNGLANYILAGLGSSAGVSSASTPQTAVRASGLQNSTTAFQSANGPVLTSSPASFGNATVNGNSSVPVNNNGNNSTNSTVSINACYLSSQSWSSAASASGQWVTYNYTSSYSQTDTFAYFQHLDNGHTTTLCDHNPRALGDVVFTSNVSSFTSTFVEATSTLTYASPSPTCSISPAQCVTLQNQYSASVISDYPACNYTGASMCPDQCGIEAQGGVARLLYWPEPDVPTLNCNATNTTIPVAGVGFVTVQGEKRDVSGNATSVQVWSSGTVTITSPTIAMYFESISRIDGCGPTISNHFVTLHPSEASTLRGYQNFYGAEPIKFQDFNKECVAGQGCYAKVSLDAYIGQPSCANDLGVFARCMTIWDDYNPNLSLPSKLTEVTSLAPMWGPSCGVVPLWGAWDPPVALTQEAAIAAPTVPTVATTSAFVPTSTSASPASTPESPATNTASAAPDTDPTVTSRTATSPSAKSSPAAADPSSEAGTPAPEAGTSAASQGADSPASTEAQSAAQTAAGNIASLLGGAAASSASAQDPGQPQSTGVNDPATSAGTQQDPSQPQSAASNGAATSANTQQDPSQPQSGTSNGAATSANGQQDTGAGSGTQASVGGQVVSAASSGGMVVIGSTTLQPGQEATINNTPVSVATGAVVVGGSENPTTIVAAGAQTNPADTQATAAPAAAAAVITAGSQTITAQPGSNIVVDSSTLSIGGGEVTLSNGQVISLASSGVVVDGSTQQFSAATDAGASLVSQAVVIAGSQTITAQPGSSLVIGSSTLSVGGGDATLANGQTISLASNGVVVDGTTQAYSAATDAGASIASQAVVTAGSETVTARPGSSLVLGSSTLSIGGGAATLANGQVVSLASNGVVVDGTTQAYSAAANAGATPTSGAVITAGSQVITAQPGSALVLGLTTLSVGGAAATLSNGEIVSLASNGVVVDGTTQAYSAVAGGGPSGTDAHSSGAVLTIGFQAYTAEASAGTVVFAGQTLTPGQAATINGQVVSDAGSGLVVGSTTLPFSALPTGSGGSSEGFITAGTAVYTAIPVPGASREMIVEGNGITTTLSAGGPAVTINGEIISEGPNGLVAGSSGHMSAVLMGSLSTTMVTIGSNTFTAIDEPNGDIILEDASMTATLSPGGSATTVDGELVSAASNGLVVASGTQASTVPFSVAATSTSSLGPSESHHSNGATLVGHGAGEGVIGIVAFAVAASLIVL